MGYPELRIDPPDASTWRELVKFWNLPAEWAREVPTKEEWDTFRRKVEIRADLAECAEVQALPTPNGIGECQ